MPTIRSDGATGAGFGFGMTGAGVGATSAGAGAAAAGVGTTAPGVHGQPLGSEADFDRLDPLVAALDQELGDRVLDVLLNGAPQRAGAHVRIVAALRQKPLDRGVVDVESGALRGESRVHVVNQQPADLRQLLAPERVEHNRLVDAVDELGREVAL